MGVFPAWNELQISYVRSSGPGGQNVNKVNSKCVLRWNPAQSAALSADVLHRFIELFRSKLTTEGDLILTSDRFRDQKRNLEDCIEKLASLIQSAKTPPRPRKKTRPTFGSRVRKKKEKKSQSDKKRARSGRDWD